nr:rhodanese-like domain-containing protein [Allonocardiopsis opalescens]
MDALLARAREGLRRVTPVEAAAERDAGAMLVDIRPEVNREGEGLIPGALVIDRNVLEWRLDPTGRHRLPVAGDPERRIIVFCNEGYASSLAAASLREIGLSRATDLIGGYRAWRESGLPTVRAGG